MKQVFEQLEVFLGGRSLPIESVEAIPISCPLDKPVWHAGFGMSARSMVLVVVRSSDGAVGYGEAGCVGSPSGCVKSIIDQCLTPHVVGKLSGRTALWGAMEKATKAYGGSGIVMHAISGVDMALWDLAAKQAGLPLWMMLGGAIDKIACYGSAGLYSENKSTDDLAKEMAEVSSRGFSMLKMKVGMMPDDHIRVKKVLENTDPKVKLAIDANGSYHPKNALSLLEEIGPELLQRVAFFEEPVDVEDVNALSEFRLRSRVMVAGGENLAGLPSFRHILETRCVDMLIADVTRCGGVGPLRDIGALAAAFQTALIMHSFSSALSLAANLHVAAAINARLVEVDATSNSLMTAFSWSPKPDSESRLEVPHGLGLGIEPDMSFVARYRVD